MLPTADKIIKSRANEWAIAIGIVVLTMCAFAVFSVFPTLFLAEFKREEHFRFSAAVRFNEKDADHFCNGQIRNPIAFGYYQVDNIACHYKTPGEPGSHTIWTAGWDIKPSTIVNEKDMKWLFQQHTDEPTGYQSYSPLEGMGDKEKSFYQDNQGNWRINETGEIAPKAKPDQAKLDKILYGDEDICLGAIEAYLWAKSAYSKVKPQWFLWVEGCYRVHPKMKKLKLTKGMDGFLTKFLGSKEAYREEIIKNLNQQRQASHH
jgi:hypothetical protein